MLLLLFISLLGLVIGSFLSALTYRIPRGESFVGGRSKCDRCGKKIKWFDNIPLLSYLLLGGECRDCGKEISIRYPLIELSTATIFLSVFLYVKGQALYSGNGLLLLAYYLLITIILIAIFIIDLEMQIIPDGLVFILIILSFSWLLFSSNNALYSYLFSASASALFLLLINLITKGRGMGLGDVKLAFFGGLFFGYPLSITWLFLSFIIGAILGLILVAFRKTRFGKRIAFGPFLVGSFFLTLLWGDKITAIILPYL